MKKLTISTLLALGVFALAGNAAAQGMGPSMMGAEEAGAGHAASVESVLGAIYEAQGASAAKDIDCGAVTDEEFEALGDAYMEAVHPGETHEYMDRMMGGEGSVSLREAHVAMGRAYLGCWSKYEGAPFAMPMMMSGYGSYGGWGNMMGGYGGKGFGGSMMGYGYAGSGLIGGITGLVWLVAGVLLILFLVKKLNGPTSHE